MTGTDAPVVVPIEDALDLHPFAPREIPDVVGSYLEAAADAGFTEVRLIHGKGRGVQRERVRRLLAAHALVRGLREATPDRGGAGATVVTLVMPRETHMSDEGPNAEQRKYWNEASGPKWVALQEVLDEQIAVLGLRAMERAAVRAGDRVLDVGCGCGGTTLELARRAGPTGSVTGADLSEPMLARARERAAAAGLRITFVAADAQTHPFAPASCDVVFSRFGVMFFADPTAAFRNLHRVLAPGGRLAFVCWQAIDRNPWAQRPLAAAARHLTLPPPPPPGSPGPFALADPDRVRTILRDAGFADVALDDVRETLTVGGRGSLDQAVEFLMQIGPAATALREAGPALRPVVAAAVRDAIADAHGPDGVRLPSASWVVSARRA